MTVGTLLAKTPLTLHTRIGEATNESTTVEVWCIEPTREPMIVHEDGRAFRLSWGDILKLAQDAFAEDIAAREVPPCE